MPKVRKRTGPISVLGKCFSLMAFVILLVGKCNALTVSGIPEWLGDVVNRGLSAVWREIPDDPLTDREGTLELVASRLFSGYIVKVRPGPAVSFLSNEDSPKPLVRIILPELRGFALSWFSDDVSGMEEEVSLIAAAVPQNALTWADEALRERVSSIVRQKLPGWDFTQQIYISPTQTAINLSFRPSREMILAVKPSLYSRTIPVMLRSDLEAKMLPELSPLIGLPVKWAELHRDDIESLLREMLEDRHTVENMKADVSVKFSPGRISDVEARVDSRSFMFSVWVAAYAGLDGRYPEAGAFFGFRPIWRIGDVNFAPEIYGETVFTLDDFGVTYMVGTRFELLENFWGGIEYQLPDGESYVKLQYMPLKIRRPYAWLRWSAGFHTSEGALGYRFDEHISVEIYYDGDIGLRGIWNL